MYTYVMMDSKVGINTQRKDLQDTSLSPWAAKKQTQCQQCQERN